MNECSYNSPIFWGWIPHLDLSFEHVVDSYVFRETLQYLDKLFPGGFEVLVRDHDKAFGKKSDGFGGRIWISFQNFDQFEFGLDYGFNAVIKLDESGCNQIDCSVSVLPSGLVRISVTKITGSKLKALKEISDIRTIVREVYFALKKLFHFDIFNESEDLHNSYMKNADDTLSIVSAEDEKEAVVEIFKRFSSKLELMYVLGYDKPLEEIETRKKLTGYKIFAESFVRSCMNGSDLEKYLAVISMKYEAGINRQRISAYGQTDYMQKTITRFTVPIWIFSMVLTIVAGTMFYEYFEGNSLWEHSPVVVYGCIFVVVLFAAVYLIYVIRKLKYVF